MKSPKIIQLLMLVFLFCIAGSCSKRDDNEGASTSVTTSDMLNYYIVFQTSTNQYKIIYFVKENNAINAYYDGLAIRKITAIENISGNVLNLKYTLNNQLAIFTFNLNKDSSGNVTLGSYSLDFPGYSIVHAEMYKNSDAPVFLNSFGNNTIYTYTKASDEDAVFLYFNQFAPGTAWKYDDKHGPSSFMPLYAIGNNVGWKSNDESTFGIAVNKWWNHNFAVMLIQTNISELDAGNHIATTF